MKIRTIVVSLLLMSTLSHAQNVQSLSLIQTFNAEDYINNTTGEPPIPLDVVGIHQIDPSTVIFVNMEGYIAFYDVATKKISKTIFTGETVITHSYYSQETRQLLFCEHGKILSAYSLQGQKLHLDHKIVTYPALNELTINDFTVNSVGNQVVYEGPKETLAIWDLKKRKWKQRPLLTLSIGSFKLAYFNDSTLFSGSYTGYLQRINPRQQLIVKCKHVFDDTIFDFAFSTNRQHIAITDQEIVKILPIDLKSSVQINPNIALITQLLWMNESQLLVVGVDGLELWDFPFLDKKPRLSLENIGLDTEKAAKPQPANAIDQAETNRSFYSAFITQSLLINEGLLFLGNSFGQVHIYSIKLFN